MDRTTMVWMMMAAMIMAVMTMAAMIMVHSMHVRFLTLKKRMDRRESQQRSHETFSSFHFRIK
jgi:hypothetical protein